MAKRKPLPKGLRFEVLKRDHFTCQYCGASAPEAILQVDHIRPVADGGTNDIFNLITACFDCNIGKGAKPLDSCELLSSQVTQLELAKRRSEQFEILEEWRKYVLEESQKAAETVSDLLFDITGYVLPSEEKDKIAKLSNKFGSDVVFCAARIAFTKYDVRTDRKAQYALEKIGGICFNLTHKTCKQCSHSKRGQSSYGQVGCNLRGKYVDNKSAETCKDFNKSGYFNEFYGVTHG